MGPIERRLPRGSRPAISWRCRSVRRALLATLLCGAAGTAAQAEVVDFEIVSRESPTFEGRSFGDVGAYEKIVGRARMAVDPSDPANAGIVDLDQGPANAQGEVEFTADVTILRPVEAGRGNGRLLYDVLNRGRKLGLVLMNDAPGSNEPNEAAHAGNGFLMEEGYTVVWSGWQGDLAEAPGIMRLDVPVVEGITGTSREEAIFEDHETTSKIPLSYPASGLDPAKAKLTVRERPGDARETPPGLTFRYLSPTEIEIERPQGFSGGAIYEFVYPAKDPKVLGLGFAATRDIVSFLRGASGPQDENPLAANGAVAIEHAYGLGISQSGRFLRDMLYQGFNRDEAGNQVFDGLMPHIAGSRKTFTNYRFAQLGRYSRQHEDHDFPGDQFPFTYAAMTDPVSGAQGGLMEACKATDTCPRIIHVDTDAEGYQARATLLTTTPDGEPVDLDPGVRLFYMVGAPHFSPFGAEPEAMETCQLLSNPLHVGGPERALLVALDAWVSEGTEPPESRYPGISEGSAVLPAEVDFPAIPGIAFEGTYNVLHVMDHATVPPKPGAAYEVRLPQVDEDGHALDGVRLPTVAAPLGTYLGWNLRKEGFAEGELCSLTGSFIPLPRDAAEREQTGDPRRSIAERWPDAQAYKGAVQAAAEELVAQRLLREADIGIYVEGAAATFEAAMAD